MNSNVFHRCIQFTYSKRGKKKYIYTKVSRQRSFYLDSRPVACNYNFKCNPVYRYIFISSAPPPVSEANSDTIKKSTGTDVGVALPGLNGLEKGLQLVLATQRRGGGGGDR